MHGFVAKRLYVIAPETLFLLKKSQYIYSYVSKWIYVCVFEIFCAEPFFDVEICGLFAYVLLAHSARGVPWSSHALMCGSYNFQCSSLNSWSLTFRNRIFLISWRGFLKGFVGLPWLHFQALQPQRKRSDGVGLSRLGYIYSSFRVHGKEGLFDECWMVHQDSWFALPELMFPCTLN